MNLALLGRERVAEGGSFTLTGGVLYHDLRVNFVSHGVITEALDAYASYFRGFEPASAARAVPACARSVEGKPTGRGFRVT